MIPAEQIDQMKDNPKEQIDVLLNLEWLHDVLNNNYQKSQIRRPY